MHGRPSKALALRAPASYAALNSCPLKLTACVQHLMCVCVSVCECACVCHTYRKHPGLPSCFMSSRPACTDLVASCHCSSHVCVYECVCVCVCVSHVQVLDEDEELLVGDAGAFLDKTVAQQEPPAPKTETDSAGHVRYTLQGEELDSAVLAVEYLILNFDELFVNVA